MFGILRDWITLHKAYVAMRRDTNNAVTVDQYWAAVSVYAEIECAVMLRHGNMVCNLITRF